MAKLCNPPEIEDADDHQQIKDVTVKMTKRHEEEAQAAVKDAARRTRVAFRTDKLRCILIRWFIL